MSGEENNLSVNQDGGRADSILDRAPNERISTLEKELGELKNFLFEKLGGSASSTPSEPPARDVGDRMQDFLEAACPSQDEANREDPEPVLEQYAALLKSEQKGPKLNPKLAEIETVRCLHRSAGIRPNSWGRSTPGLKT